MRHFQLIGMEYSSAKPLQAVVSIFWCAVCLLLKYSKYNLIQYRFSNFQENFTSTLQAEVWVSFASSMTFSIYEVIRIAVSCVVGLFTPLRETQTNYVTDSDANNFINAKSRSKKKALLTGYVAISP